MYVLESFAEQLFGNLANACHAISYRVPPEFGVKFDDIDSAEIGIPPKYAVIGKLRLLNGGRPLLVCYLVPILLRIGPINHLVGGLFVMQPDLPHLVDVGIAE
jgi:hypothetical protein